MNSKFKIQKKTLIKILEIIVVAIALFVLIRALYLYCNYKFNLMAGFKDDCKVYSRETREKAAWPNGGVFDCVFSEDNVTFGKNFMVLRLDENKDSSYDYKYSGGEYRTIEKYGYGLYSVALKPIKNEGVVSSFFTYTGESDGTIWDEIDIEFLGKDTTMVQFNYYADGVGGHEYLHRLDFDASEEYHEYSFLWTEEFIRYFVDGIQVYEYQAGKGKFPVTQGKIMMNVWNGNSEMPGIEGWLGKYDGATPLYAYYDYFSYVPLEGLDLEYYNNCQSRKAQRAYWMKKFLNK